MKLLFHVSAKILSLYPVFLKQISRKKENKQTPHNQTNAGKTSQSSKKNHLLMILETFSTKCIHRANSIQFLSF